MRTFVTGAASPLGRSLVASLVRRGHQVRGQVRRVAGVGHMHRLCADPVVGDIRRPEGLAQAMEGCETVFHLATFFDFWAPEPDTFESVNVTGTKHVMAAALVAGVRRVVLCSSAVTIGEPDGALGDEDTRHRGETHTEFERSKLAAERLALRLRARGIEVVVVNPGIVVAPSDPGWAGRLIQRCIQGGRPIAAHAPLGWVWVDDAAELLARAGERGTDGRRYIACGDVMSSRSFLSRVATYARARPPRSLPRPMAIGEAALQEAVARPRHRRPALALDEARFLTRGFSVDGRLAAQEFGVSYTPSWRYLPGLVDGYLSATARFS